MLINKDVHTWHLRWYIQMTILYGKCLYLNSLGDNELTVYLPRVIKILKVLCTHGLTHWLLRKAAVILNLKQLEHLYSENTPTTHFIVSGKCLLPVQHQNINYLKKCWLIATWPLKNRCQLDSNQNTFNATQIENVFCNIAVILCGTLSIMQVNNALYKINFLVYAYISGQWPT